MKYRYKFKLESEGWFPTQYISVVEESPFKAMKKAQIVLDHLFTSPIGMDIPLKCSEVEEII